MLTVLQENPPHHIVSLCKLGESLGHRVASWDDKISMTSYWRFEFPWSEAGIVASFYALFPFCRMSTWFVQGFWQHTHVARTVNGAIFLTLTLLSALFYLPSPAPFMLQYSILCPFPCWVFYILIFFNFILGAGLNISIQCFWIKIQKVVMSEISCPLFWLIFSTYHERDALGGPELC